MLFLCPRQVRPAPAAMRSQPMAQRAIDTELILSRFGDLGVARKGIAIVRGKGHSCGQHQEFRTD